MSAQSLCNSANVKLQGNLILEKSGSYIEFSDGSQQTTAGTGSSLVGSTIEYNVSLGVNATGIIAGNLQNTAIGAKASQNITTGEYNTSIGAFALKTCTTTNSNTACGESSLSECTGSNNSAVGNVSLFSISTGSNNVAIGQASGKNVIGNASNNTFIGYTTGQVSSDTHQYQYLTLIGANSQPIIQGQDSQIVLGSTTGAEDIYMPNGSISLGTDVDNSTYTLQLSGANSTLEVLTQATAGGDDIVSFAVTNETTTINTNNIAIGLGEDDIIYEMNITGVNSALNIRATNSVDSNVPIEITSTVITIQPEAQLFLSAVDNIDSKTANFSITDQTGGNNCIATLNGQNILTQGMMQSGVGTSGTSLNFPTAFTSTPIVFLQAELGTTVYYIGSLNATSLTIQGGTAGDLVNWLAIGTPI